MSMNGRQNNMYNDFLSVNHSFQNSVNLQLDLGNERKIDEYIITGDICNVLKKYFLTFLGHNKDKSTVLAGPYGKGKSFLVLILAYLVSFENTKSETYKRLLKKIGRIDKELVELVKEFREEKHYRLLPVVINSNYDDLTQSFRVSLDDAMRDYKLNDIAPDSTFKLCVKRIEAWEKDKNLKERLDTQCGQTTISLSKLKEGLKDYSLKAYKSFKDLYSCMSMGLEFNPLVHDDILSAYTKTLYNLSKNKKQNFTGIFLIFDEFSKFISQSNDISKDLKLIQDFAELANRSSVDGQLNFCCITHKSLSLYKNEVSKKSLDSFKTVEGRFKEIRFNRSRNQNYQLISGAIKKDNFKQLEAACDKHRKLYQQIEQSGIFDNDTDYKTLFTGCFPLNPLVAFALINISEKIAQNERTLFTFISDTEENSLNSFIRRKSSGLRNRNSIYDYFSPLMRNDDKSEIHDIWVRSDAVLSLISDHSERKIVKSLAIIRMINDYAKLSPNAENIALSLDDNLASVQASLSDLIKKHLIKKDEGHGIYSFAPSHSKEIDEEISITIKTKANIRKPARILNEINKQRFILPRKYNEIHKITRFFRSYFISEEDLLRLDSFSTIFSEEFSDGLVLNVIPSSTGHNVKHIIERLRTIHDTRVVIRIPDQTFPAYLEQSLKKIKALRILKASGKDQDLLASEISLLIDDLYDEIDSEISYLYGDSSILISSDFKKENGSNLSSVMASSMEQTFTKAIDINNELVNKESVSSQYYNSLTHLIDWWLLDAKDFPFSETSPEGSMNATIISEFRLKDQQSKPSYIHELCNAVINKIKTENSIAIKELSKRMSEAPYGIRKGIQVFFLAYAIKEIHRNALVLKLQNHELQINGENLLTAIYSKSDKYVLYYSEATGSQNTFVRNMCSLFGVEYNQGDSSNMYSLADKMKEFFLGLPAIIRNIGHKDNFIGIDEEIISYKAPFLLFNINPYESIIQGAKKEFNDFETAYRKIERFYRNWAIEFVRYKTDVINCIKDSFSIPHKDNLKTSLEKWKHKNVSDKGHLVLETKSVSILKALESDLFNEESIADSITYACVGHYIEDWDKDYQSEIQKQLASFINDIKNAKPVELDDPLIQSIREEKEYTFSPMGSMLKNSISSSLEEYGDSVSKEEKIRVLTERIKSLE